MSPDALTSGRCNAAAQWREAGQAEHASIAAFARFVMNLLAVGAPPQLLRAAIRAMDDELEHTHLCFGLARSLDGQALGPGPLDITGVMSRPDSREMLESTIREGCVVETIAASLAVIAGERATDLRAVEALRRIASDELRHAELAWEFVAWMLERRVDLREAAATCFSDALSRVLPDVENSRPSPWDAYGQLSPQIRVELAAKISREVVLPRATSLFASLGAYRVIEL